jgi:hypothetical protein
MKAMLLKFYWVISSQFGLDIRLFINGLAKLPKYIQHFLQFSSNYKGNIEIRPCLHDWHEEGGSTYSEYFWQDLYIAQKIHSKNPKKHLDIGSRIDGFVAHIASFRIIEVIDIRPITSNVPNILFKQADLMSPLSLPANYCDSLSCLHALEHFGLGRYGDPISVFGYKEGLKNMSHILQTQGTFYLSVPIGQARVEFNAHRVFDPYEIVQLAEINALVLEAFAWVQSGVLTESSNPKHDFASLVDSRYALGIFTFRKQSGE